MLQRHLASLVEQALTDTRVVFIIGARQVGKSTLASHIAKSNGIAQVTLDDQAERNAAVADPTGYIAEIDPPALIDEVQRAPDLLMAIKKVVDQNPEPGRFLLTGSANILTAPRLYEALTGRIEILRLWPLSQSEIEGSDWNIVDALFADSVPRITEATVGRPAWVSRAAAGGFPEALSRPEGHRRTRWFSNYLTTTLERDLRDISHIHKLSEMPKLLRSLAWRAGNVLVASELGRSLSLTHKTVSSYTRVLETVFLVRVVPGWRPGIGSREKQAPKVHLTDTGLLTYLLNANLQRATIDDQIVGKLFENFVAMEIAKHIDWAKSEVELYHYRDHRAEIDLVLEGRSGELVAVECKAAASISEKDARTMSHLRDVRGRRFKAGIVFYCGERTLPLGDRLWAVPVEALWRDS